MTAERIEEIKGIFGKLNMLPYLAARDVLAALEEAQQTIANLQTEYADERASHNYHVTELLKYEKTIARKREALEFYASEDTYKAVFNPPSPGSYGTTSFAPIVGDGGERARTDLGNKEVTRRDKLMERLSNFRTLPGHWTHLNLLTDDELETRAKLLESMFEEGEES